MKGSLFNHSQTPNISYTLDPDTESIRYTATRTVREGEELCIFYGHKLWFKPTDIEPDSSTLSENDDGWGGLSSISNEDDSDFDEMPHFLEGHPDEIIPEDQLPFVRMKLLEDEAEDELSSVRTGMSYILCVLSAYRKQMVEPAWVIDVPDPRHTNTLLKSVSIADCSPYVLTLTHPGG